MKNLATALVLTGGSLFSLNASAADDTSKLFDSAWSAMGFILGYGDHDAYVRYACSGNDPGVGKECDGPPEKGMVSRLTGMIDDIIAGLDISACKDVPESGTKKSTVNGTEYEIKFGTPNQSIPSAWVGGGTKFDKRMEFDIVIATSTTKLVVEGSCKYPHSALIAMNMTVGEHAPGYTRPINVWLGTKAGKDVADIYVSEVNTTGDVRGAYGFSLSIDSTANTYQIWGASSVHYNDSSNDKSADIYNLTGNYVEHNLSLRVRRVVVAGMTTGNNSGSDAYDVAAIKAVTGSDVASLPATTNYDLVTDRSTVAAGSTYEAQGCMDFDTPSTAPTSASACTGLDWSDAPTPVADADGNFGAAWVLDKMDAKFVELPTL